jgi:oligopeptide/dipeptide ABC transporter ATP-binding protein
MLEVRDLVVRVPVRRGVFRRAVSAVHAVDGVSIRVGDGETLGLVGESGCGKTTLGKCILRLVPAQSGEILLDGESVLSLSERAFRPYRRLVQIIFQDPFGSLNPRLTVGSIIEEPLLLSGMPRSDRPVRVAELLHLVGLSGGDALRYPHEFSGGQRQRVGIARALAVNPRHLVCDEPVSALDVSIQSQILNLLEELQEKLSLSYLFITHDLYVVRHIADRVAVMYLGKIMEEAPAEEIFANPLHPYTKALLASAPSLDPRARRGLAALPGEPGSSVDPPPGCRFAHRCPHVMPACREGDIASREPSSTHRVRCVLYP